MIKKVITNFSELQEEV